jgi:hypothetical protein
MSGYFVRKSCRRGRPLERKTFQQPFTVQALKPEFLQMNITDMAAARFGGAASRLKEGGALVRVNISDDLRN